MQGMLIHPAARRRAALLLILALCLSLAACGTVPAGSADGDRDAPAAALIPEATLPADPFAAALGRWQTEDGGMELWIEAVDASSVRFSLYAPGRAALDQVLAQREGDAAPFLYQDPFRAGDFSNGSLRISGGVPCLSLSGTDMDLPGGTETAFPVRLDAPGYDALYAPVLEAYRAHEEAGGGLANWYGDEEGYVHVGLTGAERYGYCLRDLDRNGVPELILGVWYTEEDFAESAWLDPAGYEANLILDLYTLVDGAPTYIVNSGDRYRYALTNEGLIQYEGSGGAAYSTAALLRLEGAELEICTAVCIDGGEDRCFRLQSLDDYEHVNDQPISYEDYTHISFTIYNYRERLCLLLPLLRPVTEPASPAGEQPAAGTAAAPAGDPYAQILMMYAALQTQPYSRMAGWELDTPPTWQMLEQRYSIYYDDSPFLPCSALFDLNGDGRDELFIGLQGPDGEVSLREVYTSDGTRAYRIGCDAPRGIRMGDGLLCFTYGRSFPRGEILCLEEDGYRPRQLLCYETLPADPAAQSYDGDEASLGGYRDGSGEEHPYSELKERYLEGMVPAEELLRFAPIAPAAELPGLSPDRAAERAAYAPLLALYEQAAHGENEGEQLDGAVMAQLRKNLSDTGRHELCYAYFDGDCDGAEELYVGYPGIGILACYRYRDDGSFGKTAPARFTGAEGVCIRAPWRYIDGYPVPGVMNED